MVPEKNLKKTEFITDIILLESNLPRHVQELYALPLCFNCCLILIVLTH